MSELAGLRDVEGVEWQDQVDDEVWPARKAELAAVLRMRKRFEWGDLLEHTDVCFAPVLTMSEATQHPHMVAREVFIQHAGHTQPDPAPRFSRTPSAARMPVTMELGDVVKEWLGK